jgi:hypothetical protein
MLRAYIAIKSARVILAFLLFGSISGFVLGQEMHHPSTGQAISVVKASASGSLGASIATSHTLTIVNHVQTAPTQHQHHNAHHDDQHDDHHDNNHHEEH